MTALTFVLLAMVLAGAYLAYLRLPQASDLADAVTRIGRFLDGYGQP